jgi:hypothetical protein
MRYRAMVLAEESPTHVKTPIPARTVPADGFEAEISSLDSNVWSLLERRRNAVRTMLPRYLQRRIDREVLAERQAWEAVNTRADWERFRDERLAGLRESLGTFPPPRPPLDVRVSARYSGKGYTLENLVFQSRPGVYVTANLYLPEKPLVPMHIRSVRPAA